MEAQRLADPDLRLGAVLPGRAAGRAARTRRMQWRKPPQAEFPDWSILLFETYS